MPSFPRREKAANTGRAAMKIGRIKNNIFTSESIVKNGNKYNREEGQNY
jgi:hypothetical protein